MASPQIPGQRRPLRITACVLAGVCNLLPVSGQETPPPPGKQEKSEVVTLDPFKVTNVNAGYGAQFSNSSSRLNLKYIDVPQTVNVVTSEFLTDTFIFDSRDFSKFITGVTPRTNTHQAETYFIRGLQTTTSYVDGFLATVAVNRDAAFYDRVEYVKGPASAAIGRGEAGGLVNFVQKKPAGRNGVTLRATAGTDAFYRGEVDYNRVLGKTLSFRLPMVFEDSDGTRGGPLMHTRKYGAAPALSWRPFERTEINLATGFFSNTTPGAVASAHWMHPDLIATLVDRNAFNPNIWYPGPNTPLVPFENVYAFDDNYKRAKVGEGSMIITHKFSDFLSLRQGFRVEHLEQDVVRYNTPPAVARNAAMPSGYQITMTLVKNHIVDEGERSQTDLLYEKELGNTKHSLLGGFDIYRTFTASQSGQRGGLFLDLYQSSPVPPPGYNSETWVSVTNNGNNESEGAGYGYYAQYSGHFLNDKIMVMAGWRKDKTKLHSRNLRAANNQYGDWREEVTDVPRYSVTYKPTTWASIYYVHSEQADPLRTQARWSPDTLLNGATSYTDGRRDPDERITSQVTGQLDEIGVKATLFGGRLTASVAAYEIGRDGFIQNDVRTEVGANGIGTIQYSELYLADGEQASGVELEIFGQPTRNLTMVLSAVDQKGTNPRVDGTPQPIDALFDEISFHGKYSFRDRNRNGFEVTGGGKYWFGGWTISNASFLKFNDDQYTLNAGVSYYWGNGRQSLRAYGSNVTDEVVYINENSQYTLRRLFLSYTAQF